MLETDLKTLMKKIAKRDPTAFRDFSDIMGQRLFGLCYNLMNKNRQDAEDMLQNSLIKIWQQAPNWQDTGSVTSWVMTIAHNICMDEHRKRKDFKGKEIDKTIKDEHQDGFEDLAQKEQHQYVINLLEQLPTTQRQVMYLSFLDGLNHKQIAEILDITPKSAEHHYYRGLEKLKNQARKTGVLG